MKKLTIILLAFALNATAQEYKLGKVTLAELQEKEHPKDPSAAAAILFETAKTHFEYSNEDGYQIYTDVEVKIKIYKKEGYEWANKSVFFYTSGQASESVMISKAATYNLVNGAIEKSKLKSDGEFIEKINKWHSAKKIALPAVKEGCIIEYAYTIKSPFITSFPEWNFQTSIPVNHSEYKTCIPEYFTYTPNQKGFIFPKVTVEKTSKTLTITEKELTTSLVGGYNHYETKHEYTETQTLYVADNLPAMKDENFVNNIDNYTASISHELAMTKYPNSTQKYYSTDWESVVTKIYEADDFGTELNKTGYFEDDLKVILAGLSGNEEKIAAIFNFVKSKVKWNNFNSYYCNEGVRKAYKDGVGNVAEINLMLTAMLRFAGIEANPVLVSTRSNGIAFFPNRTAYNYVISAVEVADGLILMDATDKFSVPNVLPTRDLNWFGRLIRKDKTSSEVDLMPKTLSREVANMNLEVNKDGKIDGKIKKQYSNNIALGFRQKHLSTSKDSYLENLENKNNNIEISDYVRENDTDLSKTLSETYNFKSSNDVEIIGDKIFVSPLLFLSTKENPFKQETREYPVDFGYPVESKYNINIKIPDGYTVESLPKAINLSTGENIGTFKYIIAQNENNIQIAVTETINAAIVPSDYYDILKDFFKQMVEKENEKIVLKKI